MSRKQLTEIVESFFNVDNEYSNEELESFDNAHSIISIGAIILFSAIAFAIVLFLASNGVDIEIDHIKDYN